MQILLKKAKIINPGSPHHLKRLDILVDKGIIQDISKNISPPARAKSFQSKNLHVSSGFIDIGTQICEPGFETRETLDTIRNAAFSGGYTGIASLPNTQPIIQNRSEIEYLINRGHHLGLQIHPIGALSHQTEGHDLTQMMEMHEAGAVGFSDGRKSVQDSGLLLRALLYTKPMSGLVINLPYDQNLVRNGQINEGKYSTLLGIEGIPAMSEELMVQRDIALLDYAESKLHLRCITTKDSVQFIKDAQKNGLAISADVSAFHLLFQDADMETFNSQLKVYPPFRTKRDILSLIKGLMNGTIQHICSLHEPLEEEQKKLEFTYADFGSLGLESAFAMAHTVLHPHMTIKDIVSKFTDGPRDILSLEKPKIEIGETVNLSIFDPDVEWTFEEKDIRSQSKNAAAIGRSFIGKALGAIHGNIHILENSLIN